MKELSVFVDESGDFGEYESHSPYYIVSLVLHDQKYDICDALTKLENELSLIGYRNNTVHCGPIIRSEEEYRYSDIRTRQNILKRMMAFIRHTEISCHSFYVEKKHLSGEIETTLKLSKQLSQFIRNNYNFFQAYDVVKIYYDNGQIELTKILATIFSALLENVQFRKVIPSDYRLFQVADVVCTMKLAELKCNNGSLSKSEMLFFNDARTLKKNYIKPLAEKNYGLIT